VGYYYAIGPVSQSTDDDGSYYHAPLGSVGWIDTRPLGPTEENGFFAYKYYPTELESTHAIIGDGNRLEEYIPTALERSAWETLYGVAVDPSWTLFECLRQLFFVQADPDGLTLCKPHKRQHLGFLELHLGGHSRILKERFTGKAHAAWPTLQKLQQLEMARLIAEQAAEADAIRTAKAGSALSKRIAERAAARKDGASFGDVQEELAKAAEAVPGKALTDICKLYKCDPKDVLPKGVEVERLKPETSVSDDFNRADGAVGASWTARTDGTFEVSSNKFKYSGTESNIAASRNIHHATALSGQAHWAQVNSSMADANWIGPLVRGNASDHKCYTAYIRYSSNARVLRYINGTGTATTLWTDNSATSGAKTYGIRADGSSITLYEEASDLTTQTNSNATGLYVGINTHPSSATSTTRGDDFSGADILAATAFIPGPLAILRIS